MDDYVEWLRGITQEITEQREVQERQERFTRGLQEVLAMTDELLDCETFDDLLRRSVELPRERLGLLRAQLFLFDPATHRLHGTYGTDMSGNTRDEHACALPMSRDDELAFTHLTERKIRWYPLWNTALVDQRPTGAVSVGNGWRVITPIVAHLFGLRIGVFYNDNAGGKDKINTLVQELLALYCNILGRIMHRKQLEDALRDSEQVIRRITDNMTDIISQADVDGIFTYISPSIHTVLGYTPDQLLGQPFLSLIHPDDALIVQQALGVLRRTEMQRFEARARHVDGHEVWLETIACSLRDADGTTRHLILTCRDITLRKDMEMKLAHSHAELQQFAYIASHDLQAPLRKIITFSDRLQSKYATQLDDAARDYLDRMAHSALRMRTLIEDLLMYSRVMSSENPFAPVDLNELANQVLDDLEQHVIDCCGQVEVGQLPTVEADARQMQQLLQNLISNALKFAKPDVMPHVSVEGRVIADNQIQLTVRDNGIGFDEKYLDRIFLPFQRLHTESEYPGSGIGLGICQKIVQRHGGSLTAHSRAGEGATFVITLPATHPETTEDGHEPIRHP